MVMQIHTASSTYTNGALVNNTSSGLNINPSGTTIYDMHNGKGQVIRMTPQDWRNQVKKMNKRKGSLHEELKKLISSRNTKRRTSKNRKSKVTTRRKKITSQKSNTKKQKSKK